MRMRTRTYVQSSEGISHAEILKTPDPAYVFRAHV
jgi:hypothetical protein